MSKKNVVVFASLALVLTPAMNASMSASCRMHMSDSVQATKLTTRVRKSQSGFEPFNPIVLLSLLKVSSLALPAEQHSSDKYECPRMKSEQLWREWKSRNPGAVSRYAGKKNIVLGRISMSLNAGADDPEPDPGFGKCGCDPETALGPNGCGWIHENIWH